MKTKQNLLKYAETLIFITIWLLIFAAPILVFQQDYSVVWSNVFIAWFGVLPFFLLFSINHFVLVPFLLFRNRKTLFLISALLLLFAFSVSTYVMEKGNVPGNGPVPHGNRPPPPNQNLRLPPDGFGNPPQNRKPINLPPFVNTIIISFLVVGFDSGLRLMSRWSKLVHERELLEKENIENQLAFLRNQVSPHFFMNTLNNIHALIDIDTEEAKESVIKLSKLMRHILYDSEVERIPIKKEVEFIRNYIALMKLRFTEKVLIQLSIPETLPDKSIPPLLFTSFLENAFKHGISYSSNSFINITIEAPENKLHMIISNSIGQGENETSESGIGIVNTRKRLDLLYKDDYTMNVTETHDSYTVNLTIPL